MKITLSFDVAKVPAPGVTWYYLPGVEGPTCYAGTNAVAAKKLRAHLESVVKEALEARKNTNRGTVFTVEGTVLVVYYSNGSWGYDITRPGGSGGSCWGDKTFEEALGRAREHAGQCYGGERS